MGHAAGVASAEGGWVVLALPAPARAIRHGWYGAAQVSGGSSRRCLSVVHLHRTAFGAVLVSRPEVEGSWQYFCLTNQKMSYMMSYWTSYMR